MDFHLSKVKYVSKIFLPIIYNYSMLMRSIHEFIALTKNNNIDLMTIHDFIALTKNNNIDLGLRPQVDIVILGQCD